MKNQDIRLEAAGAGVRLWQIAEKMNYNDCYFSRKLRHDLSAGEKERIRQIIAELREKGEHVS